MTFKNKPKILFFAPILEYPPAGGPQLRVVNAVKVLNSIAELHIVTNVSPTQFSKEAEIFFKENSFSFSYAPTSKWISNNPKFQKVMRRVRRLLSPLFAFFDVKYIIEYSKNNKINNFWLVHVLDQSFYVFSRLRRLNKKAFIVGDTDAVQSVFILRELPMINNPLRWSMVWLRGKLAEVYQKKLVNKANITTAVSEIDANFFRKNAKDPQRVMLFSNVVDLTDYQLTERESQVNLIQPSALLLGSFGHKNSPMDRAAVWLVRDIMPHVWKKIPDAHLYIIGRNSKLTQSSLQSKNVTVVGQVPSVTSYLHQAVLTLVPLRHESGTRFKIIESGAASLACVSTSLGAEGLDVSNCENIVIADDEVAFANAIIKIFTDEPFAKRLGANLHGLVTERYSLKILESEAIDIMKQF